MSNVYTVGGVALGATAYRQIHRASVDPALETFVNYGGRIDPTFAAVSRTRPLASFSSHNLGLWLGLVGLDGLAINTTFDVYLTKYAHGGTRADNACVKCTFNDGLLVLRQITGNHAGEAEITIEAYATYDGTNAPLIVATGATLGADATAVAKYTIGGLKYGSTIMQMQSQTFDNAPEVIRDGYNGETYDRLAAIANRRPTFSGRTLDLGIPATFGGAGYSATATMFWRKKTNKGNSVADATEEHISMTATGALWTFGSMSADEGGQAGTDVTAQLVYDLTNAVVVIDTTAAIA